MEELEKIYFYDREEWRAWLTENSISKKGVWIIYYKKHTKKPTVSYNEAVEEAICFGWIDGRVRRIDEDRYMQYYSPRTPKSSWSVSNMERANKMIREGLMTKLGLEVFQDGINKGRLIPSSKNFDIPSDLHTALSKNLETMQNFQSFSPSAQLAYVYWVNSAKRDETRKRRIKKTVELTAQNKRIEEK